MSLETKEWLVWLGLRRPGTSKNAASGDVELLKEHIGDYSAFTTVVDNSSGWSSFNDKLVNNGLSKRQAARLIDRAQEAFTDDDSSGTDWDEYKAHVQNATDYIEYQTGFPSNTGVTSEQTTSDEKPIAGVRIHDTAGVSYDGVQVPAGTTEIFGKRVEFSQQGSRTDFSNLSYSNLSTDSSNNTEPIDYEYTISATVSNANSQEVTATVPFLADNEVVKRKQVSVPANGSVTVEFTIQEDRYICRDVAIGDLSAVQICWTPPTVT